MGNETNYTNAYKDKISHDLALEIIEEIALALNVNLYGLMIGRDHSLEEELKDSEYGHGWGENERTWEIENDYILVECYYAYDKIEKVFERVGVDLEKLKKIWVDG